MPPPTPSPTGAAPPARAGAAGRVPAWAPIALILSGLVLIVVDTADLLFFAGLAFLLAGVAAIALAVRSPALVPRMADA